MENVKEKETKRRFFRRTGLSRAQRSLDSSSPVPSHSPSLENNSMTALAASTSASSSIVGSSTNFGHRGGGGSSSLDENVINNKIEQHRRFMAAPRRARSAERFDGMRIAFNNSPGGWCTYLRQCLYIRSNASPGYFHLLEDHHYSIMDQPPDISFNLFPPQLLHEFFLSKN
ncbi:unnamed protein product [Allacma fusca]|uniref:Uncharacterized protein n=1 Tax=Allacma fusca TaxID=39272 RepID=A0A8J2LES3_9HEXA|nr:unnamed protein product [Allacma fusca]